MIFNFVVRRLHWLARVPLAPHLFDALLLAWTALLHRDRLAAFEMIEANALELSGVRLCRHRFGGVGFMRQGREFAHIHGNGLLDVRLSREEAERLVVSSRAQAHHVFGRSNWVSFWVKDGDDVRNAMALVEAGYSTASRRMRWRENHKEQAWQA